MARVIRRRSEKMKRFCLLSGFFLFLCGSISLSEAVVDRVVAVVNQEIITLSEVEKWIDPARQEMVSEDRLEKREQNEVLCRQVLEKLIEEKLIDQEVKRAGVKISSKEIDAALEDIKQRNAATQEDFEKALAIEGLTIETYKKQIEKGLQRRKLISWSVKVETKAGEKELREFYENNVGRYRTNETYRASHILFTIPKEAVPDEVREIRKKAQSVLEKIKKGEDFGEMALLYSQDASAKNRGDLGYFKKGELFPAFEKEALRLKVGEVSELLRTEFGFHIIKLLDRKGVEPLPFEEVKNKVKADYYETEMDKAFRQFLSTLKEKSVIEIKL
ncbi:MAG TPA: peptidylprolyl isomerase [Thermodesulfobacteriota bacterium]|nr:peptidylprolyl isomerase [Thermodesulfobacteriota bacterium]